ncbi:hypothetical protein [Streptomyces sp. bgisy153]|uniref:hypothetical protein n=1 Tax=Streptomyces sp. bgisy153 TaxID=3413793 RepID=UPI003D709B0B
MRSPAKHAWTRRNAPLDTEGIWRAVARSVHLAERELTPATITGRPSPAAGSRAAAYLSTGHLLLGRLAERHAEGARTRLGRAWRLHSFRIRRSAYAAALDEGLAYARAAACGCALPRPRPALFRRTGRLPELERFLPDRMVVAAS